MLGDLTNGPIASLLRTRSAPGLTSINSRSLHFSLVATYARTRVLTSPLLLVLNLVRGFDINGATPIAQLIQKGNRKGFQYTRLSLGNFCRPR